MFDAARMDGVTVSDEQITLGRVSLMVRIVTKYNMQFHGLDC